MIYEILFCLSGHPGDVLTKEDFPLLDPFYKSHVKNITKLGKQFILLEDFIGSSSQGSFIAAFKLALSEYLDNYKSLIVDFESRVSDNLDTTLQGERTPLALIEIEFAEYFTTFPWLIKMIDQINQANLAGSNLMNSIKTLETQCGSPEKLKIFSKILQLMYRVWNKKLVAWLIQGTLNDPHCEFMISHAESA
jgi:hypothetical protein